MYRRLMLLLLILLAPLQALAALQMGLSSHHVKDLSQVYLSVSQSDRHLSAHHDHHTDHHAELAKQTETGTSANCTDCDLCMPPLAFTFGLKLDEVPSAAAFGPVPTSIGIIPPTFDRPPRSARLA